MLGNVDGLVEHYPSDGLMAGGRSGGAVVGHVVIRVGHQAAYREALDEGLVAAIADAFQLIGEHAQLRIGQIAQLQNMCESEKATLCKARERADLPAARWRRRQCPGHDSGHQRNLHTAVNYSRRFVSARETESEKEMVSEGDRRMLNTCVSSGDAKSAACYLPLWPTLLLLNLSPKVYKAATTCSPCLHSSQTSPGRLSAWLGGRGVKGEKASPCFA